MPKAEFNHGPDALSLGMSRKQVLEIWGLKLTFCQVLTAEIAAQMKQAGRQDIQNLQMIVNILEVEIKNVQTQITGLPEIIKPGDVQ